MALHYKLDHLTEDSYNNNNQSVDMDQKRMVCCIAEKEEMFQTLMDLVNNNANYSELFDKICEFFNFYTQNTCIKDEALVEYVLPIFTKILTDPILTPSSCILILESLVRLFKN